MSATDIGWLPELYRHNAPGVGSVHFAYSPHIIQETIHCCNEGHFDAAERTLGPLTEFVSRIKYGDGEPHVFPSELNGWAQYSRMAKHKALTDAFGFLKAGPPRPPTIPVPQSLTGKSFLLYQTEKSRTRLPACNDEVEWGESADLARF